MFQFFVLDKELEFFFIYLFFNDVQIRKVDLQHTKSDMTPAIITNRTPFVVYEILVTKINLYCRSNMAGTYKYTRTMITRPAFHSFFLTYSASVCKASR